MRAWAARACLSAGLAGALLLCGCGASAGAEAGVHIAVGETVAHVFAIGTPVEIAGRVRGDVYALGADVRLDPTARVQGNVGVLGGDLTVAPGARVPGFVFDVDLAGMHLDQVLVLLSLSLVWTLLRYLVAAALVVAGVLVALAMPTVVEAMGRRFLAHPWRFGLAGLYGAVAALALSVALAVTLVLAPAAVALLAATALAAALGIGATGFAVGDALAARFDLNWPGGGRKTALGLGLLMAGTLLPLVGPLLLVAAAVWGLGLVASHAHSWIRSR